MTSERFPDELISEALESALAAAGHLNLKHAATVALVRTLAARADMLAGCGWVDPETDKFDNVTIPTLLNALKALGLTVEPAAAVKGRKQEADRPAAPPSALGQLKALHGGKVG